MSHISFHHESHHGDVMMVITNLGKYRPHSEGLLQHDTSQPTGRKVRCFISPYSWRILWSDPGSVLFTTLESARVTVSLFLLSFRWNGCHQIIFERINQKFQFVTLVMIAFKFNDFWSEYHNSRNVTAKK